MIFLKAASCGMHKKDVFPQLHFKLISKFSCVDC